MKKHFNYDFEYLITIKDDAIIGSHIFTASTLDNFQMNDLINCFAYLDQSLLGFPLTFLLVNFIYYNLLAVLLISKFYLFFKYFQSQDFFILLLYYFRLFMVILYLIMWLTWVSYRIITLLRFILKNIRIRLYLLNSCCLSLSLAT